RDEEKKRAGFHNVSIGSVSIPVPSPQHQTPHLTRHTRPRLVRGFADDIQRPRQRQRGEGDVRVAGAAGESVFGIDSHDLRFPAVVGGQRHGGHGGARGGGAGFEQSGGVGLAGGGG